MDEIELVSSNTTELYPVDKDQNGLGKVFIVPKEGDIFLGLALHAYDDLDKISKVQLTVNNKVYSTSYRAFESAWIYHIQGLKFPAKGPIPIWLIDDNVRLILDEPVESIEVKYWVLNGAAKRDVDIDLPLTDRINKIRIKNGSIKLLS